MKHNGINATAIALNITDEHFDFTMSNVGQSKVDKMMIEKEFQSKAVSYCDTLDEVSRREGRVDFIEVENGKVKGSWFNAKIDVDDIPLLIGDK
jgi:shikimate 5-dehydrogenase